MNNWPGIIEAYRQFMPLEEETRAVTLFEGGTPLIPACRLGAELDIVLYLKYEGCNPTGSFKDRGMSMAVTGAAANGAEAIICASTGNTSAAAAAYGARSGLNTIVIIPEGKIALGKLAQALMHGARVIPIRGNFDRALELVKEISERFPVVLVNSLNPDRIEGQKSAAFEICDQLQDAPDVLAIPVGNAGNITAYWKGFREYQKAGLSKNLPVMMGFEAEGAAAIFRGEVIKNPETVASAIRIGNPASWEKAEKAAGESGGLINYVTDREILEGYYQLASKEGVFVEPASAASLAGVKKMVSRGIIKPGSRVVAVLTGHGLKDPDNAIKTVEKPPSVPAELESVLKAAGLN